MNAAELILHNSRITTLDPKRPEALIYANVPEKLHLMAGKSVHSHLKKLKKDGRVSEERIASAPSRWTLL